MSTFLCVTRIQDQITGLPYKFKERDGKLSSGVGRSNLNVHPGKGVDQLHSCVALITWPLYTMPLAPLEGHREVHLLGHQEKALSFSPDQLWPAGQLKAATAGQQTHVCFHCSSWHVVHLAPFTMMRHCCRSAEHTKLLPLALAPAASVLL